MFRNFFTTIDHRLICLWINAIAVSYFFLDEPVYLYMRDLDNSVRSFFYVLTDLGLSSIILVPTAILATICLWYRKRVFSPRLREGLADISLINIVTFVAVALTGIFAALSKQIIGRARPKLFDTLGATNIDPLAFAHAQASFPSGHTTTTFAFAFIISLYMPNLRIWAFSFAAWVGLSRVVTGAHYLSDVIAGALVGVVGALLIVNYIRNLGFKIEKTHNVSATVRYGATRLKRKIKRCL